MRGCCDPSEYDSVFTADYARRKAEQFRTTGLDGIATQMVDFATSRGLDGATVLEIGGGVGGLHLELLRRGASVATNIELSRSYETEANRLLESTGMTDRVTRCTGDLATDASAVEPADVVVLHRVVCCYPDFPALLDAAAEKARRMLVFSYPRPHLLTRAETLMENLGSVIRRQSFRSFVHSPTAMSEVLAGRGLEVVHTDRSLMWQFTGTVRTSV